MTGFGSGTAQEDKLELTLEINSVNRKGLEVNASLPKDWQKLEPFIAEKVKSTLKRGKLNITLNVKDLSTTEGLSWNKEAVQEAYQKLDALSKDLGIELKPDGDFLMRLISTLGTDALPDAEALKPLLDKALDDALGALCQMRATEGAALKNDTLGRLNTLSETLTSIEAASTNTVARQRELLLERLKQAGLELNLEDERILKELALFADRCDITEEITRLKSHLDQFVNLLESEGSIGRKLDFLCQEVLRELNTIGSKANNIEITRFIIDSKNELECIREQVQNIE
tara:strand:- start:32567 stop:33427 length:861 start_codon:yes stop_codon:yes gene_type:complete